MFTKVVAVAVVARELKLLQNHFISINGELIS
jgi:hypothetical protein